MADITTIPLDDIWRELERRFPFGVCVGWVEPMPESSDVVLDVRMTGDGGMAACIVAYMRSELDITRHGH